MSNQSPHRPFGERGDEERPPFGSRRRRTEQPDEQQKPSRRPTDPYTDLDTRPRPPMPELVEVPEIPAEEEEAIPDSLRLPETDTEQPAPDPEPEPEPEPELLPLLEGPPPLQPLVIAQSIGMIVFSGLFIATMFTWWTPNEFLPAESREQLSVAQATQDSLSLTATAIAPVLSGQATEAAVNPAPLPQRIGIVSGHRGIYPPSGLPDPGAVCEDGLTEREVNERVAFLVRDQLEERGYTVDVLDEFDERLPGYRALAMVSIHADSCEDYGEEANASGYKVASFDSSTSPERDQRLVNCLSDSYAEVTGLRFHPSVTFDMTHYHNFNEIDPNTPGAIIEIGFMFADRDLLTGDPERVARGITLGVVCYLDGGGE